MTLLAIGAHPDDVELGCGGSLAAAAERGRRVVIADLTRGELASAGTPATRAREAARAARALGAARVNLGLEDGAIARHDPRQLAALVELLRRVRPLVVLAPAAGDRHPDHGETHHLARRAAHAAGLDRYPAGGEPHRPETLLYYPSARQALASPPLVVDITATWDRKLVAVDCYASQLVRGPDDPPTPLNAPDFRDWLAARSTFYGGLIGAARGEPFLTERPVALCDPLVALGARCPAARPPTAGAAGRAEGA